LRSSSTAPRPAPRVTRPGPRGPAPSCAEPAAPRPIHQLPVQVGQHHRAPRVGHSVTVPAGYGSPQRGARTTSRRPPETKPAPPRRYTWPPTSSRVRAATTSDAPPRCRALPRQTARPAAHPPEPPKPGSPASRSAEMTAPRSAKRTAPPTDEGHKRPERRAGDSPLGRLPQVFGSNPLELPAGPTTPAAVRGC